MQMINCNEVLLSRHSSINYTNQNCSLGKRVTSCYELDYILSSDGGRIDTEGKTVQLIPQMLFFREPGTTVEGFSHYSSWYLQFKSDSPIEGIHYLNTITSPASLEICFETLYSLHLNRPLNYEYKLSYFINQLLYDISLFQETNGTKILKEGTLPDTCLQYLEMNWNKPFSLEQLITKTGYSKSHFFLLFKDQYHTTPLQYLIKLRMTHACQQLLESRLSIKEIQYFCGYSNEQLFFRHFKKYTGYSPLAYRIQHMPL